MWLEGSTGSDSREGKERKGRERGRDADGRPVPWRAMYKQVSRRVEMGNFLVVTVVGVGTLIPIQYSNTKRQYSFVPCKSKREGASVRAVCGMQVELMRTRKGPWPRERKEEAPVAYGSDKISRRARPG